MQLLALCQQQDRDQHGTECWQQQLLIAYPQDLSRQQIAQVFATVRIVGEQQDAAGSGEHEQYTDLGLLHVRPALFRPGQQGRTEQGRRCCGELGCKSLRIEFKHAGDDHAECRDLRQRQVDEHDAAAQDLGAKRHMRDQHQAASHEGR